MAVCVLVKIKKYQSSSQRHDELLLHQIHVAGYKYPGRAIESGYKWIHCRRDDNFVADTR